MICCNNNRMTLGARDIPTKFNSRFSAVCRLPCVAVSIVTSVVKQSLDDGST